MRSNYKKAFIRHDESLPQWQMWIPPTRPEHYDEAGNWIDLWGITYFPTFEEALEAFRGLISDIHAGREVY